MCLLEKQLILRLCVNTASENYKRSILMAAGGPEIWVLLKMTSIARQPVSAACTGLKETGMRLLGIYMAAIASSRNYFYTDNSLLMAKAQREHVLYDFTATPKRNTRKGETGSTLDYINLDASVLWRKHVGTAHPSIHPIPRKRRLCTVIKASRNSERHLKSLDSYLGKLHDDVKQPSSSQRTGLLGRRNPLKAEDGLKLLEDYLGKVKVAESENYVSGNTDASLDISGKQDEGSGIVRLSNNFMQLKTDYAEGNRKSEDSTFDFYIIGLLVSMDIAVFLFEIAAPVKNSNYELYTLPLVYGAKINNLILSGEWWRLVTPMFLHSGIFHVSLSSWALFTFGPEVSREYGSFTFLLIYVLGGISGNLISFLHTPDPTVGGMVPVFAVIGAWLIYQVQNKDVIAKDTSETMFQKAIIATALSCILSNFGPVDDWAHFSAVVTGVAYGFLTCPTVKVKDGDQEIDRQQSITLIGRYADPCKSLMYFSLFLLALSSLLLIVEPPLYLLE